ncbi:zinc finger protein ZIC 2-like [Glycine soja]|uniref:zinc finger protein ZIC 2-like n=1 Tax=Glycine soja TaxID=3848 RepID=UPI00103CE213|nr:zinc finger protein ZIC 2-like [Glycine soja]
MLLDEIVGAPTVHKEEHSLPEDDARLFIKEEAGSLGSSSAAIRRNTLEGQRCPLWYCSSQVKQSPRSRREAISSGERRFRVGAAGLGGSGVGWVGGGRRGGNGVGRGGGSIGAGGGRGHGGGGRWSRSFSSCRQARPAAWASVNGW